MFLVTKLRRRLSAVVLIGGLVLLLSASVHGMPKRDIVETAVRAGDFKTLVAAVKAAGLVETLKGKGPFTVFAPTDQAFDKLPAGTVKNLLKKENKAKLTAVLTYHVVGGEVMSTSLLSAPASVRTVNGKDLSMSYGLQVNGANVTTTDIKCSNGVIHVIDEVLLPPAKGKDIVDTAVGAGQFKTLVAAVKAAGLVPTLKGKGPFTVFAPTDAAFDKLPAGTVKNLLKPKNKTKLQNILTYHVVGGKVMAADVVKLHSADTVYGAKVPVKVKGDRVMVGDASVVKTDIKCSNGVIHVIDSVLMPPEKSTGKRAKDIVDTAVGAGQFKTLVAAVKAADLVKTLKGKGPFTVFAPTDEAFGKLPAGTVKNLLKKENKAKLTAILTYHVLSAKVMAADLLSVEEAETLNGAKVAFSLKVMPDKANVIKADIGCSNGVIHVIDAVMLP